MIVLNYKDKTYRLKNGMDEFIINEFEFITNVLNDDEIKSELEKWKTIINYLGLPFDVIDEISFAHLESIINAFELDDTPLENYTKKLTIDNKKYKASKTITVKQITLVEEYLDKDSNRYVGELMAIIFREEGKTRDEHFTHVTIVENAEIFRYNITMDKVLPYINLLTSNIFLKYNNTIDE
jgi:hypothetical protein